MKRQLRVITFTMLIICFGILEAELDSSGIPECKTEPYPVEGRPTLLLLPVPINLQEEQSYIYVKRLARNSNEDVIILDSPWNEFRNFTIHKDSVGSYVYVDFCNNTLFLLNTNMSAVHEGIITIETNAQDPSKRKSFCNLTMAPAAGKQPVTSPDPVDKETAPSAAGKQPVTSPDPVDKETTPCTPTVRNVVEKSSDSNVFSKTPTTTSLAIVALSVAVIVLFCLLAVFLGIICCFRKLIWETWETIRKTRKEDKGSNTEDIAMGDQTGNKTTDHGCDEMDQSHPASTGVTLRKLTPWDTICKTRKEDKGSNTEEIAMGDQTGNKTTDHGCDEMDQSHPPSLGTGATLSSNRQADETIISMPGNRAEDEVQSEAIQLRSLSPVTDEDDAQSEPESVRSRQPDEESFIPISETDQLLSHTELSFPLSNREARLDDKEPGFSIH